MTPCRSCEAKCCRYLALEIETPRTKEDFEQIRWFLAHKGISVYTVKSKWHMQVANRCRYLTKDHKCRIYHKRPDICREHDNDSCEHTGHEPDHDREFRSLPEIDRYLEKRFSRKPGKNKAAKRRTR